MANKKKSRAVAQETMSQETVSQETVSQDLPVREDVALFEITIDGEPIPLAKVAYTPEPRMWDAYKQARFNFIQTIKNKWDRRYYVTGPLELEATFYLHAGPSHPPKENHIAIPCIFSLFNFIDHALQGVIYKKDCTLSIVRLKKIYDSTPRTEITIRKIVSEKKDGKN